MNYLYNPYLIYLKTGGADQPIPDGERKVAKKILPQRDSDDAAIYPTDPRNISVENESQSNQTQMNFKKFLYSKPIIIEKKKKNKSPPPEKSTKKYISFRQLAWERSPEKFYSKVNKKKYVIDRNNNVRIILNENPLTVKYLNNENIDYISKDFIYSVDEFKNINNIRIRRKIEKYESENESNSSVKDLSNFDKYILQTLNENNIISDILVFDSDLINKEYSLGNLKKYIHLINDLKINYILVKLFERKGSAINISIYVIGDIYTDKEIHYDIGLGYIAVQGDTLLNLYPNFLPKGWGSALLCLFLKISKKININYLFLQALDFNAKLFYERLGFEQDILSRNPLDLKINMYDKILNDYCLEHKIDLNNYTYMLKINDKIYGYMNLYLDELIDLINYYL